MNFNKKRTKCFLTLLAMAVFVFFVGNIKAQSGTSSIRGSVADPQGNAVVGASVTLTSEGKNFTRTQITTDDGQYVFIAIPPGIYRLEVESNGFKKSLIEKVEAQIDTPKTLDISLELGQISELITVTGDNEPQLNTVNGSLGDTITTEQISQLPLSARNTPDLLSLQTGVTPDNGSGQGGSVNGGRKDQANVTLDGVDVNEQQGGRAFFSVLRVTPESLQEFRVTTSNADANFGRSSGAQISLITKAGGNQWHGSGYFYFRPSKMFQANDFFNNLNGVEQLAQERRNYGGSLLGPIIKDKLFFAAFYERFEENSETPVTREVPLPSLGQGLIKYRVGDGLTNPLGGGCNPSISNGIATLSIAQINACYTAANGFTPGVNPIGLSLLASAASRYTANDSTVGDGLNTSGYRFNAKTPVRQNVFTTRLDGKITDRQDVFARFQYQFDNSSAPARFPDTLSPNTWIHPTGLAAGHSWNISNNVVNRFTYGLTREAFTVGGDSQQNFFSFRFIFQPLNYSRTLSRITPVHNFVDDFTFVKGNHTFSAGANVRLISNERTSFGASYDNASTNPSFYDFSGDVVIFDDFGDPIFPNVGDGSLINLRDALTAAIGRFSQYGLNLQYGKDGNLLPLGEGISRRFKTEEFEWYAQDSWRVFNNLTVNYGVRWSTSTPVYEADGLQVKPTTSLSDFFNQRTAAAFNGQSYNNLLSVDLAGKANKKDGYYKQDWNNFAPAISAAWSPNFKGGFLKTLFGGEGKSTIRGGVRKTFDRIGSALAVAFDLNSTLGYSSTRSIAANTFNVSDRLGPLFTGLTQNYRNVIPTLPIAPTLRFPLQTPDDEDFRIEQSLDDKLTTPSSYSYNVSYGREIWKGFSFEASFVGRIAKDLLTSRDTAHFNNLRDPATGQTFYSVMNQLLDFRNANAPITSIPNIAWFNRFVPGLARNYTINGVSTPLTATQAAYRRVARDCSNAAPRVDGLCTQGATSINGRNTNDYTFVQLLWDDGLGAGNNLFIHPQYATFAAYSTIGKSSYNSFQLNLNKRFDQGLQFDINYTYGHSIDTVSGNEASGTISSGASLILNPLDLKENQASSDFDVRHLVNANFIYQLPFGKGRMLFGNANKFVNALIGGWQLTGIYRWNTGFPIGEPFDDGRWATNWNVQSNGVRLNKLEKSPTLNGAGGLPNIFSDQRAAYQSFRNARPGEAGDRNILREPNYVTFDAGLYKSFNIKENQRVTFRLEVFNVTNTQRLTGIANFALELDPNLKTPPEDFGRLTQIQGSPRVVQFAVRYDF